jgi:hypothetical protein
MQTVTTIGLDIAKSVFQVHGVDAAGQGGHPPSAEAPLRPGVLPKLRRAWLALRPVLAESIAGRLAPSIANSDSKEPYRERRGSAFHRTFLREAAKPIRCFQGQILLMECPLSRTDQRWKCPFIWGEAVMPTSRSK